MAKKVKVQFRPRTNLRVAYKGKVYRLSTEEEGQFVEPLFESPDQEKEVSELLEHLKKIGLLVYYSTEVEEEKTTDNETNENVSTETSENTEVAETSENTTTNEDSLATNAATKEENKEEDSVSSEQNEEPKEQEKQTTKRRRKSK